MINRKKYSFLTRACTTVFIANAILMMLELTAGRLASEQLGSSIYTWTTVIGVTLAGLTLGNYAGGRIADFYSSSKTIAGLFAIASISCAGSIYISNNIDIWLLYWVLSWPVYVFIYISVLFLLPSVFLGAITPVVAKIALDGQLKTGKTIGSIYAFSAGGSIFGTFIAGFWLISAIGIAGIIWTSAAALLIMGLYFYPKYRLLHIWAVMLLIFILIGTSRNDLFKETGVLFSLRKQQDPNYIYQDETKYCSIRVLKVSDNPDKRIFLQDKLMHSKIEMNDITNFQYEYIRLYSILTQQNIGVNNNPSFLVIGGGGFVLPRYLKYQWPAGKVDVAEIDPGAAKAAIAAFGLQQDHGLNIFNMDGRNFIDDVLIKNPDSKYDFIYGDAYDHFSVPYQLVTAEYNEKIKKLMNPDGFYMLNIIDVYDSGLVLGSILNTLQQTFKNVYIFTPVFDYYSRTTFILIASNRSFDTDILVNELSRYYPQTRSLNPGEIDELKNKSGNLILTDDYAPVDNLAAPIAVQDKKILLASLYMSRARKLSDDDWNNALELYMKAVLDCSPLKLKDYVTICNDLLSHRAFEESFITCQKALKYYEKPAIRADVSQVNLSMSASLRGLGRVEESKKYLGRAIDGFKQCLSITPNATDVLANLGMTLAGTGDFKQAQEYLSKAVKIAPANPDYHFMLITVQMDNQDYLNAADSISIAITSMKQVNNLEAASRFQKLSEQVQSQKAALKEK